MTRRHIWVFVALLWAAASMPAGAGAQQATLADVEDEVMCPICGTLLELSNAPQAERQRALISRLIAAGETKAEIKDALVAQYGNEVLALPEGSGFNLSAYLVPAIGFVLAVLALAIGVARWRRAGRRRSGPQPPADGGPKGEEAERLDADLARYDL
jgi:cytochrome c-type biogenesis protein CcmH